MTDPAMANRRAPSKDGPVAVRVMHASPGRLRVKVGREGFESSALRKAEQDLGEVRGVLEVRRNPAARSILVRYDPDTAELPAMFAAVAGAGVTIEGPESLAATVPDSTPTSAAVFNVVQRTNGWVSERMGGRADLRALVPASFAALALREILAGRLGAVPWYTLAWWAFDSFYKLNGTGHTTAPPEEQD